MIVLLDTHSLIWALEDSKRLSPTARAIIVDGANVILASAASAWEIAIKQAIGRIDAPDDIEDAVGIAGFTKRSITFADAHRVRELPPIHRDPFDRLLVAQALVDDVAIVTKDPEIAKYPVRVIW